MVDVTGCHVIKQTWIEFSPVSALEAKKGEFVFSRVHSCLQIHHSLTVWGVRGMVFILYKVLYIFFSFLFSLSLSFSLPLSSFLLKNNVEGSWKLNYPSGTSLRCDTDTISLCGDCSLATELVWDVILLSASCTTMHNLKCYYCCLDCACARTSEHVCEHLRRWRAPV